MDWMAGVGVVSDGGKRGMGRSSPADGTFAFKMLRVLSATEKRDWAGPTASDDPRNRKPSSFRA